MAEQIIAGVVLSERVSAGTYGIVFRAQYHTSRDVRALLIDPQLLGDSAFRATLSSEASIAAWTALSNPNIVSLLAVESEGADVIVVTRGIGAYTTAFDAVAKARSRGQTLPPGVVVALMDKVLLALEHVHHNGMCHGAVHARSVLLDRQGNVYLSDFGVGAALAQAIANGAESNLWRNYAGFVAPEIVIGESPTEATDVFAAGALLAALLYGELPSNEQAPTASLSYPELYVLSQDARNTDVGSRVGTVADFRRRFAAACSTYGLAAATASAVARAAGIDRISSGLDEDTENLLESLADVAAVAPMRPSADLQALATATASAASSRAAQPAPASSRAAQPAAQVEPAPTAAAAPKGSVRAKQDTGGLDSLIAGLAGSPVANVAPVRSEETPIPITVDDIVESPEPPQPDRESAARRSGGSNKAQQSEAAALSALDTLFTGPEAERTSERSERGPSKTVSRDDDSKADPTVPDPIRPDDVGLDSMKQANGSTKGTGQPSKSKGSANVVHRSSPQLPQAAPLVDTPNLTRSTWWIWALLMVGIGVAAVLLYQRQEQKAKENKERLEEARLQAEELSRRATENLPTPGTIEIRSQPGEAAVWLSLGRTPFKSLPLSSGVLHELRVELDGFDAADTQVLPGNWSGEGDTRKATVTLAMRPGGQRLPAFPPPRAIAQGYRAGRGPIEVTTSPAGAQVWLFVGNADAMRLAGIESNKEYEFRVIKEGYVDGYVKVSLDDWSDDAGKKELVNKTIELRPLAAGSNGSNSDKPRGSGAR